MMQNSAFLAEASSRYDSLYFILFLATAIAALIWLVLWLLSDGDEEGGSEGDSGASAVTGSSEEEVKSEPAEEPDASEEPAKSDEKDPSEEDVSESEGEDSEDEEEEDEFQAATEEEAASLFAADLSAGTVKQDPVYSIIYTEAPDEVDDLKKIKGVAKVLEGKLNGIGVYRFKQVAVWTDAACQEFSKLLTFKNRIYSDNWIAQAKALHEEKYDEKL